MNRLGTARPVAAGGHGMQLHRLWTDNRHPGSFDGRDRLADVENADVPAKPTISVRNVSVGTGLASVPTA